MVGENGVGGSTWLVLFWLHRRQSIFLPLQRYLKILQLPGCKSRATMLVTILIAAIPLLALLLFHKIRYYRTKQYADIPQLQPSLLWGHLKALNELVKSNKPNLHVGKLPPKLI